MLSSFPLVVSPFLDFIIVDAFFCVFWAEMPQLVCMLMYYYQEMNMSHYSFTTIYNSNNMEVTCNS